ncbi:MULTISPECIES: hypothetical protein [Falsihalocynthiibacter]|uniref:hypothetical protein n=1 Tax=Falsihalocynthiibacter TaxID=2854182 RepID=UPI00300335A8
MSRISRNITIILRAERLMAQRRMAVLRRQTVMMVMAGIAAGLGIVMLNGAAYFELATQVSKPMAALIVAFANFLVAGLFVSIANHQNADADVASVAEVRDLALEDLEAEIQDATQEAKLLAQSVRSMARDPFAMFAPGLLNGVVAALLKALKK